MNLFHAPWLRQPNERAGHYTFGDPRRRSGLRRARPAAGDHDPDATPRACAGRDDTAPAPSRRTGTHAR
jgi:hypothetical protein